jgi:hypothetical protein
LISCGTPTFPNVRRVGVSDELVLNVCQPLTYYKNRSSVLLEFTVEKGDKKNNRVVEVLDSLMGCDLGNICAKAERSEKPLKNL